MKTILEFCQTYWIIILSLAFLIFAILIIKQGIKDAREMPMDFEILSRAEMAAINQHLNEPDEYSCEAYFGSDEKEIESLKEKLVKYRNYSDIDEGDITFLNRCE